MPTVNLMPEEKDVKIELSRSMYWMAIPFTGLITLPVVGIGLGPDLFFLREEHFIAGGLTGIRDAIQKSFKSFGIELSDTFEFQNMKYSFVPIKGDTDESIKGALNVSDIGLAIFSKQGAFLDTRFINWDREKGKAIGAILKDKKWNPILLDDQVQTMMAIRKAPPATTWDVVFSKYLRDECNEFEYRLIRSIEYERQANHASSDILKFALKWIALEAMLPDGDVNEGAITRRLCLLIGAPRNSDSKKIVADVEMNEWYEKNKSKKNKEWGVIVQKMYKARCSIFHDGGSDITEKTLSRDVLKQYRAITSLFLTRVHGVAISAIEKNIGSPDSFWNDFVITNGYPDLGVFKP